MLFQSPRFWVFLLAVYAALLLFPRRRARHGLLLAASYLFYAAWDPRYLGLIVFSTAVDFLVGRRLAATRDPAARRRWLALSVVTNLGLLGVFKYLDFFAASAAALAARLGVSLSPVTLDLVLPVGISFYTFQSMSYTLDVYRGELTPEPSPARFALYVAFFPQLVAGPIVRARDFLPQLARDGPPRVRDLPAGALLFSVGLFKKIALADRFAQLADPVFATPELFDGAHLSMAALAYAFQIYCDFSGYSDMAIGVARALGYRLPRNFDRPYSATRLREFWRRWHISLSTWLRDYLYISLGGSRAGALRTRVNLLVTMLLGGLWHGAGWTFVLWGALHGAALALEPRGSARGRGPAGWLGTQAVVLLGWVLFRASTLAEAGRFLQGLTRTAGRVHLLEAPFAAYLLLLMAGCALAQTSHGARAERAARRLAPTPKLLVAGALFAAAQVLTPGDTVAFLYFQF